MVYHLYTDGSASGNPQQRAPAGWAFILIGSYGVLAAQSGRMKATAAEAEAEAVRRGMDAAARWMPERVAILTDCIPWPVAETISDIPVEWRQVANRRKPLHHIACHCEARRRRVGSTKRTAFIADGRKYFFAQPH